MAGDCDIRRGLSGVLAISAVHFGSWGLVSGGTAELLAQSSQLLAAARGQEAIVAHLNKPLRQPVLQEAADELLTLPRQRRLDAVQRHRQWQATLDKDQFFDQVFGATPVEQPIEE